MDNPTYFDTADRRDKAARATDSDALQAATEQPAVADVEFGSGWYHDVAIRESEQPATRKH